jgi:Mn2+/Fe2+ NRAMP family transporter
MKVFGLSRNLQGFSSPPLMLLIMLMTNKRAIMRDQVNSAAMNVLGGSQRVPSLQVPLA